MKKGPSQDYNASYSKVSKARFIPYRTSNFSAAKPPISPKVKK